MAKILKFGLKRGRLLLPATCLALLFAAGVAVWPQTPSPAFNITVTGQSMIRVRYPRSHARRAVATISPLLKGDVIFTNFEAAVIEKGAIDPRRQVPLSSRSARRAEGPGLQPGGAIR